MKADVSYLIPVKNPQSDLINTLKSIDYNYCREVIIIDDYSTKNTHEFDYARSLNEKIFVYKNQNEPGIAHALNFGLKRIKGEFVARLDNGDLNLKNRIEIQMQMLKDGADIAINGMLLLDGGKIIPSNVVVSNKVNLFSCLPHPTWLINRKSIKKQYCTTSYRCEDFTFLIENNFKIVTSSKPVVIYDNRTKIKLVIEIKTALSKSYHFLKNRGFITLPLIFFYLVLRTFRILFFKVKVFSNV